MHNEFVSAVFLYHAAEQHEGRAERLAKRGRIESARGEARQAEDCRNAASALLAPLRSQLEQVAV